LVSAVTVTPSVSQTFVE